MNQTLLKSWLLMLLMLVGVGSANAAEESMIFNFEDNSAHRTSGSNSYTGNSYSQNGVAISLTYADAVTTGSPLSGNANIMGRVAKNTTNSPSIVIGPINNTGNEIKEISYRTKGVAAMTMVVSYSSDNSSWNVLQTLASMSTSATKETIENLSITDNTFYLRFSVSVPSSTGSNRDFQLDDIVITYGTTDSRQVVSLSFPVASTMGFVGEAFTAPTLTVDPVAAASEVVFASGNTSVATVAADGTVTLVAAGSATVTASISESANYKDVSTSYTLNVVEKAAIVDGIFYRLSGLWYWIGSEYG